MAALTAPPTRSGGSGESPSRLARPGPCPALRFFAVLVARHSPDVVRSGPGSPAAEPGGAPGVRPSISATRLPARARPPAPHPRAELLPLPLL